MFMFFVDGSAKFDLVVRAPHIPVSGKTVFGHDFKTNPGFKEANQAVTVTRAVRQRTYFRRWSSMLLQRRWRPRLKRLAGQRTVIRSRMSCGFDKPCAPGCLTFYTTPP